MIGILIPSKDRSDRFQRIIENINSTTVSPHKIYFIIEDNDFDSIAEAKRLNANIIISSGRGYRAAINLGYLKTTEEFLLLGSDDIVFTQGWDLLMLDKMNDEKIGIVGGKDDWPISQTGLHGSHLLVRRSYIEEFSGVEDEDNVIYSSSYQHFMTDIETEQTAMKRAAFASCEAVIEHNHYCRGTALNDSTYEIELPKSKPDELQYNLRRNKFEQYLIEDLQKGIITPVPHPKLSVVVTSYNVPNFLKVTMDSLYTKTFNEHEVIIVDDCSTDKETMEYIQSINMPNVTKVFLKEQKYFTNAVNQGVLRANGDFVAVINNDITFSQDWDKYLIELFDDPDVYISSPFQTDDSYRIPYGQSNRTGNVGLRGSCWMFSRRSLRELTPMPKQLRMWCSDSWLVWKTNQLGKKSLFTDKAIVHHSSSRSSEAFNNEKHQLWKIIYEDIENYEKLTGEDMKWLKDITKPQVE